MSALFFFITTDAFFIPDGRSDTEYCSRPLSDQPEKTCQDIGAMAQKGCSPDNSVCEGFFGRLKNEMYYNRSWQDISIEQFINDLDGYIKWYNEKRIKMSLGAMSPMEYRKSIGLAA